jgi:hypothetical protein
MIFLEDAKISASTHNEREHAPHHLFGDAAKGLLRGGAGPIADRVLPNGSPSVPPRGAELLYATRWGALL